MGSLEDKSRVYISPDSVRRAEILGISGLSRPEIADLGIAVLYLAVQDQLVRMIRDASPSENDMRMLLGGTGLNLPPASSNPEEQ